MYIFSKKAYRFTQILGAVSIALLGIILSGLAKYSVSIGELPLWGKLLIFMLTFSALIGLVGLAITKFSAEKLFVYPESVYFHSRKTCSIVIDARAAEKAVNYFIGTISDGDGGAMKLELGLPKDVLNVIPYSYRQGYRYVFVEYVIDDKGAIQTTKRAWAIGLKENNLLTFNG